MTSGWFCTFGHWVERCPVSCPSPEKVNMHMGIASGRGLPDRAVVMSQARCPHVALENPGSHMSEAHISLPSQHHALGLNNPSLQSKLPTHCKVEKLRSLPTAISTVTTPGQTLPRAGCGPPGRHQEAAQTLGNGALGPESNPSLPEENPEARKGQ